MNKCRDPIEIPMDLNSHLHDTGGRFGGLFGCISLSVGPVSALLYVLIVQEFH